MLNEWTDPKENLKYIKQARKAVAGLGRRMLRNPDGYDREFDGRQIKYWRMGHLMVAFTSDLERSLGLFSTFINDFGVKSYIIFINDLSKPENESYYDFLTLAKIQDVFIHEYIHYCQEYYKGTFSNNNVKYINSDDPVGYLNQDVEMQAFICAALYVALMHSKQSLSIDQKKDILEYNDDQLAEYIIGIYTDNVFLHYVSKDNHQKFIDYLKRHFIPDVFRPALENKNFLLRAMDKFKRLYQKFKTKS